MSFMSRLSKFDTFQKSRDHVQVRTTAGAVVSVASLVLMAVLLIAELRYFLSRHVENHMLVDSGQGDREFDIRLDMTFHALKCESVDLKVEDAKGIVYEDAKVHISRHPVTDAGKELPMSRGDDPSAVGCRVKGRLTVKKVAGNFHVAAGRAMAHGDGHFSYALSPADLQSFNASHTVHHLAFGPHFPGQISPLDGVVSAPTKSNAVQYQYHLKVVPTLYEPLSGRVIDSQQFSSNDFVHEFNPFDGVVLQPGAWFRYDFSPIMVRLVEKRRSFLGFLTSVCGILGGVFVLSGIVDQVLHRLMEARKNA